jgi:hypothetical protein
MNSLSIHALGLFLITACGEKLPDLEFPEPDAFPAFRGSGGPWVDFEEADLWQGCAFLDGTEDDRDHHNLLMPYRGHLVMPWAPEYGRGGLSFFDMDDPCAPERVGDSWSKLMRETHAIGFVHLDESSPRPGDWAMVNGLLGVLSWDISDVNSIQEGTYLSLPDVFYPDAYARVVLSVFWQYPWLYVAGADNGIYILDASDPLNPKLVSQYKFDPVLRAGGVWAMGNLLVVSTAEGKQTALLDISDPIAPQPIPGGLFFNADGAGTPVEAYHANVAGDWVLYARKEGGGGLIVYDIADPSQPEFVSEYHTVGNGGYVFYDEATAFVGESNMARVYDLSDITRPVLLGEAWMPGDLDTVSPLGNVAIMSVDAESVADEASVVFPWRKEVDTQGPRVLRVDPPQGATGVALTARIGVGFNEAVDSSSVFAGSIRLFDEDERGIDGWGSAQETIANFSPKLPLRPGVTYRVEIMEGGIVDAHGNPLESTHISTFTTAGGE